MIAPPPHPLAPRGGRGVVALRWGWRTFAALAGYVLAPRTRLCYLALLVAYTRIVVEVARSPRKASPPVARPDR